MSFGLLATDSLYYRKYRKERRHDGFGPPIPYNSTRIILVSLLSALGLATIACSNPLSGSAPTPVPTPNPTPAPGCARRPSGACPSSFCLPAQGRTGSESALAGCAGGAAFLPGLAASVASLGFVRPGEQLTGLVGPVKESVASSLKVTRPP